ncbi:P-loop containing nucleoside triphosphate hydrolase protein [Mycena floridula]|nr:P-loop containing nucleoside triphosphate hydrolase protein [Mycena floridula]
MPGYRSCPSDSVDPAPSDSDDPSASNFNDIPPVEVAIDYSEEQFRWDDECRDTLKNVFHIGSFRGCQLGVVNAAMDGRDVICVIPTGGGKSLTYQLPGVVSSGVTVVISPLKSLISDQIMHLEQLQGKSVKLTGELNAQELKRIEAQLRSNITLASKAQIKLCYCTVSGNIGLSGSWTHPFHSLKSFLTLKPVRFVINKAHYFTQTDANFRSNFRSAMQELRQRFPSIPITAVTANCPPDVLEDLIKTLGLKPAVSGRRANLDGMVYLSAPTYRPNLHYDIVAKRRDHYQWINKYILDNHKDSSGIIYCQTCDHSEKMADKLKAISNGKIKTDFYHGKQSDKKRDAVYQQWRTGKIKVVCATESSLNSLVFGLGINKNDVPFVLYASKSLDAFYQGSGRSGRDGKDAHCVMLYKPQDVMTLISIAINAQDEKWKVTSGTKFTQSTECRNVLFARYFALSSQLSESAIEESRCGHCNNCRQFNRNGLVVKDLRFEAWQVLKFIEQVEAIYNDQRITLHMITSLARGVNPSGSCKFKVDRLKFDQLGGKVALNAEVCSRTDQDGI